MFRRLLFRSPNNPRGVVEETRMFGLIEEAKITRRTFDGRMLDLEIPLSDWVYRSVISKNVLTLHRDYFRLRKPFERRMYELARKHCGEIGRASCRERVCKYV